MRSTRAKTPISLPSYPQPFSRALVFILALYVLGCAETLQIKDLQSLFVHLGSLFVHLGSLFVHLGRASCNFKNLHELSLSCRFSTMHEDTMIIPKDGEPLQERVERSDRFNTVSLRNDLIRAVHRVDIRGKRLLMLAISRLDPIKKYTSSETETTVTVAQYIDVFGSSNGWRDLKTGADNVFQAEILFNTTKDPKNPRYKRVRWCASMEYMEQEAKVRIRFSEDVLPYLTDLQREYASYKLENMRTLRSIYSTRLLDLLMQWRTRGMVTIDIGVLHECLEVPESCKRDFGQMRKRVLKPAIRELEKSANLKIMWNPIRKGRGYGSVDFAWVEKLQQELFDV